MNQETTKSAMPNFLVIGAAKSGTSSLYQYLGQHPDIFMSPAKEPSFFTYQLKNIPTKGSGIQEWLIKARPKRAKDLASYQKLFEGHSTEKAIGEASTAYLYFQECAAVIYQYIPNVKLIYKAKLKNIYKPILEPEIRQKLQAEYQEDILKLQNLTKQDLSVWFS